MRQKSLIIDLDGTLCDSSHRVHLLDKNPAIGQKRDFKKFNELAPLDPVNEWCREIVYAFDARGYKIVFLTGREDNHGNREIAEQWLGRNIELQFTPWTLIMREKNDYRPDYVAKLDLYQRFVAPHYDVLFAVDDKSTVVGMWRSLNIPTLHCADY